MASGEVKLLGAWQSPYALRARIALNIKSVDYDFQDEDLFFNKSEELLQSNPIYKQVPVLIHGGRPICESAVILHYIDEVWASGPPILPSDPYDRALARFWTTYIDDKWFPGFRAILFSESEDARNAAKEETNQGLVLLEDAFTKCSQGLKFFGGAKLGYLDIALGCFLAWIRVINKACNISLIDESKTPNLFKWAQHFADDATVKDVLPDTEKLYEFSRFLVSHLKGSGTN